MGKILNKVILFSSIIFRIDLSLSIYNNLINKCKLSKFRCFFLLLIFLIGHTVFKPAPWMARASFLVWPLARSAYVEHMLDLGSVSWRTFCQAKRPAKGVTNTLTQVEAIVKP